MTTDFETAPVAPPEEAPDVTWPYVWWSPGSRPERDGQACRIVPLPREGTWDAVLIEFEDGFQLLTTKLLLRPAETSALWERGARPGAGDAGEGEQR